MFYDGGYQQARVILMFHARDMKE